MDQDFAMTPERLDLRQDGQSLRIVWPDGRTDVLAAALLRSECRSAGTLRDRIEGRDAAPAGDIRIIAMQPVGIYAVNIAFSDGQARGIYPWPFLAELARREDASQGSRSN